MKEFTYRFQRDGYYLDSMGNQGDFAGQAQVRLLVEPCQYEMSIGGQVLTAVSCSGYKIDITNRGGAQFYDLQGRLLAEIPQTETEYAGFRLTWSKTALTVCFGQIETVDHYPNCDGESDRWEEKWVTYHKAELAL